MGPGVKRAVAWELYGVLIGTPGAESPTRLAQELEHIVNPAAISYAVTAARLREIAERTTPEVIILDERIFEGADLADSLAEFAATAPVILIASYERQAEVAHLIAAGQLEFVPRANEWAPLAASLIERRLRWAVRAKEPIVIRPIAGRHDIGEIFRHEINNPLTGILGNAELLLAHSDRLPPAETQRIRTVVELAVRLRETIRRVSNAWETQFDSHSA